MAASYPLSTLMSRHGYSIDYGSETTVEEQQLQFATETLIHIKDTCRGHTAATIEQWQNQHPEKPKRVLKKTIEWLKVPSQRSGLNALHRAIMEKNEEAAILLVSLGVSVNTSTGDGRTPLQLAAEVNDQAMARLIVKAGAKIETSDSERAMVLAIRNSMDELIIRLIAMGADPNTRDPESGRTPMHVACEQCDFEFLNYLLTFDGDPNVRDNENFTPIFIAAQARWAAGFRVLLDAKADCNVPIHPVLGPTVVHLALRWLVPQGEHALLVQMAKQGADFNQSYINNRGSPETPLHTIQWCDKYLPVLRELASVQRINLNQRGYGRPTLLIYAVKEKQHGLVRFLANHARVDPNLKTLNGRSAMSIAISAKDADITGLLLQSRHIDMNQRRNGPYSFTPTLFTQLVLSSISQEIFVRQAIAKGANVNAPFEYYSKGKPYTATLLTYYPFEVKCRMDLLSALTSAPGADLEATDSRGNTPLHIAVGSDEPLVAAHLVDQGARLNPLNNAKETPLDLSEIHALTSALIKHGALTSKQLGSRRRRLRAEEDPIGHGLPYQSL